MLWPVALNARDIGECIYCGVTSEPLSTEHAVPYGLNGEWTLLRASCPECAKVTTRFEREALRGLLPAIRSVLGMRSRRKKQRRKSLPVIVETGSEQRAIEVPLDEFPLYLPTPIFPPPGIAVKRPSTPGIQSHLKLLHVAGPSFEEFSQRHPGHDFVGTRVSYAPHEFARLIAKIGYCFGIYALGIAPLRHSPLRDVILGKNPFIGDWVGGWTHGSMNPKEGLHSGRITATVNGDDLHVALRLFAQFGAPEYHVILGRVSAEWSTSADWKFTPPAEPQPMPNESFDVGVLTEGRALAPLSADFSQALNRIGLDVVIDHRDEPSVNAGLEWLLPTAVVVWFTNKYLGTLLQEAAKDHYPKMRDALLRLVRRTTGAERELRLTVVSAGTHKTSDKDPVVLSIWLPRDGSGAVVFRFDHALRADEMLAAVDALLVLATAHADRAILSTEPSLLPGSQWASTVMRFNVERGRWESWVLASDGRPVPSAALSASDGVPDRK